MTFYIFSNFIDLDEESNCNIRYLFIDEVNKIEPDFKNVEPKLLERIFFKTVSN